MSYLDRKRENLKYKTEKTIKLLDFEDVLNMFIELEEQSSLIRGRMGRDTDKHYNRYVRSMLRDLTKWMDMVEDMMAILAYDYSVRLEAERLDQIDDE